MSSVCAHSVEQLEQDLRELIATVRSPLLSRLLAQVFASDSPTWVRFRDAPAAKHYHHAYTHGLLEHSVTVAQAVSALSGIFAGVSRDLAVTGALLHDIGKLDTYTDTGEGIEMTDAGRLRGEIVLGYTRVRDQIAALGGFPQELEQALLHIVLSHHGSLEHGSPVVPCTREATLVHMVDNLGSKLGSFDRIERELDDGAQWSSYDRGLGAVAYFGAEGAEPQSARLAA
jgi:3'-5' exoribonuclease